MAEDRSVRGVCEGAKDRAPVLSAEVVTVIILLYETSFSRHAAPGGSVARMGHRVPLLFRMAEVIIRM